MDSSATESPLDVLSRAATMVQDSTFNTLPPSYDEARKYIKCKESEGSAVTGGKWNSKHEQRRKTRHTATGSSVTTAALPGHNAAFSTSTNNNNNLIHHPEPLDMSITKKLRGSPPSYQQHVQLIQMAAAAGTPQRPSVITSCLGNSNSSNNSSDLLDGDGACDPVVDEHFRRSLGKDYLSIFSSTNNKNTSERNGKNHESGTEDTPSSLSVDDHFAKALGNTWYALQQKKTEKKKKKTEDSDSASQMEQVQDVSTSDTLVSVVTTKTAEDKESSPKSLLRHDRRPV